VTLMTRVKEVAPGDGEGEAAPIAFTLHEEQVIAAVGGPIVGDLSPRLACEREERKR
jgi:hypothetical protein